MFSSLHLNPQSRFKGKKSVYIFHISKCLPQTLQLIITYLVIVAYFRLVKISDYVDNTWKIRQPIREKKPYSTGSRVSSEIRRCPEENYVSNMNALRPRWFYPSKL